jgi:hypothetical protein
MSSTEWLTLPQVARAIGKSPAGVRFLVSHGRIEAKKGPRGWWLVHRTEVERLQRAATPAPEGMEPQVEEPAWASDPNSAPLHLADHLMADR